ENETIHFRELHEAALAKGDFKTGSYRLVARNLAAKVEVEYSCRPEDLVTAPYVDPDGTRIFCQNTEIADCRVLVSRRQGFSYRPDIELCANRAAHFEYAGKSPDPAVSRRHVTVE